MLIALAACGAADRPPTAPDPTEAVVPAAAAAAPEIPEFPGVVTSRVSRVITSDVNARIERLHVTFRQRVKAGDPIAKLDDTDLRTQLAAATEQERSARAEAGALSATARNARQQMKSEERLARRGFAPLNAYRSAKASYQQAAGQVGAAVARAESAKFERKRIEDQIKRALLIAPIDGVVTMIKAKEGEVPTKGTPIARVFDDRDLMIRFAVPKEHRAKIATGARVELTLEGVERPIWATVERIADEEPPITFAVVTADIDDSKLAPDEVQVAREGRVRIADAQGAKR